jgi:hypothetical protein
LRRVWICLLDYSLISAGKSDPFDLLNAE